MSDDKSSNSLEGERQTLQCVTEISRVDYAGLQSPRLDAMNWVTLSFALTGWSEIFFETTENPTNSVVICRWQTSNVSVWWTSPLLTHLRFECARRKSFSPYKVLLPRRSSLLLSYECSIWSTARSSTLISSLLANRIVAARRQVKSAERLRFPLKAEENFSIRQAQEGLQGSSALEWCQGLVTLWYL